MAHLVKLVTLTKTVKSLEYHMDTLNRTIATTDRQLWRNRDQREASDADMHAYAWELNVALQMEEIAWNNSNVLANSNWHAFKDHAHRQIEEHQANQSAYQAKRQAQAARRGGDIRLYASGYIPCRHEYRAKCIEANEENTRLAIEAEQLVMQGFQLRQWDRQLSVHLLTQMHANDSQHRRRYQVLVEQRRALAEEQAVGQAEFNRNQVTLWEGMQSAKERLRRAKITIKGWERQRTYMLSASMMLLKYE